MSHMVSSKEHHEQIKASGRAVCGLWGSGAAGETGSPSECVQRAQPLAGAGSWREDVVRNE